MPQPSGLLRRWSSRRKWTGPAILAAGYTTVIAGAGIGGINAQQIAQAGVPLVVAGAGLMLLGVVWTVGKAWSARAWTGETTAGKVRHFHRLPGPGQLPRAGDVEHVIYHATRKIDPGLFYNVELLEGYLRVNPGALRVLRNDSSAPARMTGYYVLLGLTDQAEDMICTGSIDVGVAITPALTVANDATDAVYLGMIQGFGDEGRAGAVLALIDHLHGIVGRRANSVRIYARRGHESSSRLMDTMQFRPVLHTGGIEVATIPNDGVETIENAMRARLMRLA